MSAAPAWKVLLVTHLAAAAVGWHFCPKEILDTTVKQSGIFTTDTMHILSATVLSLRAENKLLAWTYTGEAHVAVRRTEFWILHGTQQLTVPATVSYVLDLSDLTLDRVHYDERAKVVTVTLPPLKLGPIAFQPEAARTENGGLLTYNQANVDELNRINFAQARRAFTKQAQDISLVRAAQRQAKENIQGYSKYRCGLSAIRRSRSWQRSIVLADTFDSRAERKREKGYASAGGTPFPPFLHASQRLAGNR